MKIINNFNFFLNRYFLICLYIEYKFSPTIVFTKLLKCDISSFMDIYKRQERRIIVYMDRYNMSRENAELLVQYNDRIKQKNIEIRELKKRKENLLSNYENIYHSKCLIK